MDLPPPTESLAPRAAHAPGERCPIVVVDDEAGILAALRRILRRDHFEVTAFTSPFEALTHVEQHEVHVVLSDFRMPGMEGVEFLRRVKELRPQVQRVMLTGHADPRALEDVVNRSEVFRFITKPWEDGVLRLSVAAAADEFHTREENRRFAAELRERHQALQQLTRSLESTVEARTREVAELSAQWELFLDAVDDPMAVIRPDGEVRQSNRAFRERFGDGAPAGAQLLTELQGHEGPGPARKTIAIGPRVYRMRAFPTLGGAVCSFHDATEDERLERRSRHAEKMQAVGQLAGGIAHEINSPLAAILAFAQLLAREPERSGDDREALQLIDVAARRAARIIEGLQRFARPGGERERLPVPVEALFEDVRLLFSPQLRGSRASLSVEPLPTQLVVGAAPSDLEQVLVQLVQNAAEAIGERPGSIRLGAREQNGRVILSVRDDGPGIEPAILDRIFEPYFTTRTGGEGHGLGLSDCLEMVEAAGGKIRVESGPAGATFELDLPMAAAKPQEEGVSP